MQKIKEMRVQSLGQENPLEEGMAIHSILAWRIPWTEEPGRLQSIGSQRVGHNWSDLARVRTHTHTHTHTHTQTLLDTRTLICSSYGTLCAWFFVYFCGCYSFCLPGLYLWNNCQFSGFNPQSPILFLIFFYCKISQTVAPTATYVLINLNLIILSTYLSPEF